MMTKAMKLFCRLSGKNKFSQKDIQAMKETAAFKAADRNPYSWNMEFLPYEDNSGEHVPFPAEIKEDKYAGRKKDTV